MPDPSEEFSALQKIITALHPFDQEDRARILSSAALFLQVSVSSSSPVDQAPIRTTDGASSGPYPAFTEPESPSPKDFLYEKRPGSDVERIAVLAYYLTHFRETPHFKTLDLSKLNTEAAQPKFANAANSAGNAVKQGYLVPAVKGLRQLSASGERFVAALPDREAARSLMAKPKSRKRSPRKTASSAGETG